MADQAVELDSLLSQASSPTTSDHGEQTVAAHVQPPTADQDVGVDGLPPFPLPPFPLPPFSLPPLPLPPFPPSGPSFSYGRGQNPSNLASISASSDSAFADSAATHQPRANGPLAELVGTKLQSMIGLLQETVNALSQAAATEPEAEADTASLQEVIVDETERSQGFLLEMVEVTTEEEIVAYEKQQSRGWTIDREGEEPGADSWKFIWPEDFNGPSDALGRYPCARNERITLQLQLLAALVRCLAPCRNPESDFKWALHEFGPLISAIGIALSLDYYYMDLYRAVNVPPQRLVRILIEILRQSGGTDRPRVRHVLKSCYSRDLLAQPATADLGFYPNHVNVRIIRQAANLANTYYRAHSRYEFQSFNRELSRVLFDYSTTDRLLQIPMVELMQATKFKLPDRLKNLPRADGASFLVNDLNLRTLKVIGELSVKWAMSCDQHLLLDVQQKQLWIAWFPINPFLTRPATIGTLFTSMRHLNSLDTQLAKTYDFLLGPGSFGKKSTSLDRDYGSLPAPPWMTLFGRSTLGMWDKKWDPSSTDKGWDDDMHTYLKYKGPDPHNSYFCEDMKNHLASDQRYLGPKRSQLDSHTYSSYPDYKDRLRVLRAYMDTKKPKGVRGLWRDKRDTYSYYTFWGVITFGGISVLLGLLSLIASVLQTIASWKALRSPSQGSHR